MRELQSGELLPDADLTKASFATTAMGSDDSFGPQLGSKFDFTLLFDHTILSILPSGLMILLAPLFIFYYRRKPEVILPSALLWFKMVRFRDWRRGVALFALPSIQAVKLTMIVLYRLLL